MDGASGKVTKVTKPPNKYGVYEAEVKIDEIVKKGSSTFFPKAWTPQQVVDAINEAFSNKRIVSGNLYEGTTKSGIRIQISVSDGKITAAWPLYGE